MTLNCTFAARAEHVRSILNNIVEPSVYWPTVWLIDAEPVLVPELLVCAV